MFSRCTAALLVLESIWPALADPLAITGVPVPSRDGPVPLRRDINDLQVEAGPQWDLYIQAFAQMQNVDESDPLSYFQVGGIHGKPFVEWNHTGAGADSTEWRGYCPHGEPLFLSWHRAYVVLFEQVLSEHAKRIASQYTGPRRNEYLSAAETLRAPFWDWALSPQVPAATVPTYVVINTAKGRRRVQNPLSTYSFPRAVLEGKYGEWDGQHRPQIVRCPQPRRYPDSANEMMGPRAFKREVYDILTKSETFEEFVSMGTRGISLEQVHNNIHWDGACGSQFLDASFSGFDPLFMLHHAAVDRLWAYWQVLYPNQANFAKPYRGNSRFSTPLGTVISPQSPLQPFFGQGSRPYTAETVTRIGNFGYSYQGIEYWAKSAGAMRYDVILLNRLYSGGKGGPMMRRDGTSRRRFAQVQLRVEEVERPCSVNIYVGDKQASSVVVMAQPAEGLLHGCVSLDGLADLTETNSINGSIGVEIAKLDGSRVAAASVPSLKLEVEEMEVTPAARNDELHRYGSRNLQPAKMVAAPKGRKG